jgi:hypothetical protein
MRESLKIKKYSQIYKKIEKYYNTDGLTLCEACKKTNISPKHYYRICKTINKPSVACDQYDDQYINQSGGDNIKQENNDDENNISSSEYREKHYALLEKIRKQIS